MQAQESPFFNRNRGQKPTRAGLPFSSKLLRGVRVFKPFYEAVFSQILELSQKGRTLIPALPLPPLCYVRYLFL